jgi:FMN-dependent oxidoreductase (nitrilotriacetate monooxygenase family)
MAGAACRKGRQMHLALHLHPTGHHVAAWLHPRSQVDAAFNPGHYLDLARTAERGLFDLIFLADALSIRHGDLKAQGRWPQYMAYFEPLTLLSAMSAVTDHVGLVATAATTYSEPFNVARYFGSLDHLSCGRAGWNVVTGAIPATSQNFGRDEVMAHDDRYERANEFVEVVRGLWDSWDDDAFAFDRATARYLLPEKMHWLNHKGDHFSVRGPLNMGRPPQGHPVLFQAGTSEAGQDAAARFAEVVFVQQKSPDRCRAIRQEICDRLPKYGRTPDNFRLMPGLSVIVAETEAQARKQYEFLQSRIHPEVGLAILSAEIGDVNLVDLPLDEPFPLDAIPEVDQGKRSALTLLRAIIEAEQPTVRQLYERYSGARGSHQIVGTAEQVADEMEAWFRSEAADGFMIQPAVLPGGLEDFVALVVPELQRRGLFREGYRGHTLRENLGLPRPASRYA